MKGLFRRLRDRRQARRAANFPQKVWPKSVTLGLEELERRVLLNSHPVGEVPHHIHPHLAIFIDGQNFVIPASIGTTEPGPIIGTPDDNAHTHTDDGILHYNEGTPAFRDLGEFFSTWGGVFNQGEIKLPVTGQPGQFIDKTTDATHTIRFFVNGAPNGDFEQYEPEDGDQIVISYEQIPPVDVPQLNPINNVTMVSNDFAGAPARTFQVPLDGSDPNGLPLTYTVTSSDPSLTAQVAPGTNQSLRLNVSGQDIDGHDFTGDITLQLFEDLTPETTARIIQLANQGFYTNLTFHRVANDFVVQGGDPNGDGSGGSGVQFDDEFTTALTFSGFGQLAMANSGDDTNDSQFFITDSNLSQVEDNSSPNEDPPSSLNFQHTIFGQLTSGFDTFNKIMLTPVHADPVTGEASDPDTTVRINSATVFTDNQHGVLRLSAPATFTGAATVTVTATDSAGRSALRAFQVNAVADDVNNRPFLGTVGTDNTLHTDENAALTVPLPATDLEGNALTFVVRDGANFAVQPADVTVSINQATHQATLIPAPGFTGTIGLLIGVRDSVRRVDTNGDGQIDPQDDLNDRGNFDTEQVTLTVQSVNHAPTATPQTVPFQPGVAVTVHLAGDDGDAGVIQALTFIVDTLPAHGTLRDSANAAVAAGAALPSGDVAYTPDAGFGGTDSFQFHVKDDGGGSTDTSTSATVTLNGAINHAPTATAATLAFQPGETAAVHLAGDDGDAGVTQALTFTVDTLPAHGTLRDSANAAVAAGAALPSGDLTYTPDAGFDGTDSFQFHVKDDGGTAGGGADTSASATLTLRGSGSSPAGPPPRLKNHILFVTGTTGDDTIAIALDTAGSMLEVTLNSAGPQSFSLDKVRLLRVNARAGNDDISLAPAVDVPSHIVCGRGNDTAVGGAGDDTIGGCKGDDLIDGSAGNDHIGGGIGNDSVTGNAGADRIHGRRGNDTCDGGDGNDVEFGGPGRDALLGGDGNDRLHATFQRNNRGNDQGDTITGGNGDDWIVGGSHNDSLDGGDGKDTIFGAAGDDQIDGGLGEDRLHGGAGQDVNLNPEDADKVFDIP